MIGYELDDEVREILAAYERGDIGSVTDLERSVGEAQQRLRKKLKNYTEIRILLSPGELDSARATAEEHGITYQILLTDIARKGLNGLLVENEEHSAIRTAREAYRLHGLDSGDGGEAVWPVKRVDIFDEEELEILEAIERDEMPPPSPDLDRQLELARQAAYNTLKDHIWVSVWLSPREIGIARGLLENEEPPLSCETLVSNAVMMYLEGMLVDRKIPEAAAAGTRRLPRSWK